MSPLTIPDGLRTTDHGPRTARGAKTTRVAIVHDWLTGMRGGEKVLAAICDLYPHATLHTLVRVEGSVSPRIEHRDIRTSIVQRFPAAARLYRHYLPFYPAAVELIDLDEYDLVISSSHCAVKSVIRRGSAVHVCYCHSPMRYAWDQFDAYFGPAQVGPVRSGMLRHAMAALARWDADTAGRVDAFLANSQYVAGRIRRYYNRGSTVVYPPIETEFYRPSPSGAAVQTPPRFLVVSALVPYKRVDVAIEACRIAGVALTVVGHGPEETRLRRMAGPACEFVGWKTDEEIRNLYCESTAVLLPGVEDFGIVPVEAQACGVPVIALAEGGACETVAPGTTGLLVADRSPQAFADALSEVQRIAFDRDAIRAHALRFSRERFLTTFRDAVDAVLEERWEGGEDAARRATDRRRQSEPSGSNESAAREDAARRATDRRRQSEPSPSNNVAAREDEQ